MHCRRFAKATARAKTNLICQMACPLDESLHMFSCASEAVDWNVPFGSKADMCGANAFAPKAHKTGLIRRARCARRAVLHGNDVKCGLALLCPAPAQCCRSQRAGYHHHSFKFDLTHEPDDKRGTWRLRQFTSRSEWRQKLLQSRSWNCSRPSVPAEGHND